MTYLTENGLLYHKFHQSISDNGILYTKFKQWVSQENASKELQTNCRWFAELVMYELNNNRHPIRNR